MNRMADSAGKPVDTIVFDLGGVLINLNVERCMAAFEALMGEQTMRDVLGMDKRGEGIKSVSIAGKQLMADFERGRIDSDDFIRQVLRYCRPGTTQQQVMDAWMAMLGDLPQERLNIVERLRREGYRVFLLSNGNDLHFDFIDGKYGLEARFEHLFLSQRMHMAKPEEVIFLEVVQTIAAGWKGDGVYNPHCTLFVDDIETNRRAAEHYVGWQTCASLAQLTDKLNLPATYERPTQVYCSRSRAVYR